MQKNRIWKLAFIGLGLVVLAACAGPQGPAGLAGLEGPQGPLGETGPQGAPGPSGAGLSQEHLNASTKSKQL